MRTGTSALSRCLSLLGAGLPAHLLDGNFSNETGHWEPEHILLLNDRLLARLGSSWDTLRDPDFGLLTVEELSAFRQVLLDVLASEYGDAPLIVLKEPRIGRLLPFYIGTLEAAGFDVRVIVTRRDDPVAVARSFSKRDGNAVGHALLLWISYALDVENGTRGLRRTFVSYDDLMADPERVLASVSSTLDVEYPRPLPHAIGEIKSFLSSEYYHNRPGDGSAPAIVADAHAALSRLAGGDDSALHTLDGQRQKLASLLDRYGHVIGKDTSISQLAHLAAAADR